MRILYRVITFSWIPLLILILAQTLLPLAGNIFFPTPASILQKFIDNGGFFSLLAVAGPTLSVFVGGYLLGVLFGLVVGASVGGSLFLYKSVMPVLVFIRKMPSVAQLPIILALVGVSVQAQLVAVVIPVAFVIAVVAAKNAVSPSGPREDLAKITNLSTIERVWLVFLPSGAKQLLAAARSSIQLALILTLLSETLVGGSGIGGLLLGAKFLYDFELMWVAIFVVGTIGLLGHELFGFLEKKLSAKLGESSDARS